MSLAGDTGVMGRNAYGALLRCATAGRRLKCKNKIGATKESFDGLLGLSPRRMNPPRHGDADHVQRQHGNGVEAHGPGIGAGADEGRYQENCQNRVADVLPKESWADRSEEHTSELPSLKHLV